MTDNAHERMAICITVFSPDNDLFNDLLAAIDPSFLVILHIDGPTGEAIRADQLAALTATGRYRILQAPCNRGIGAALNRMLAETREQGREWVLFFDQDSAPAPDLPEKLLAAFSFLRKAGHHPAVVGPTPIADEGQTSKSPSYRERSLSSSSDRYRAVDYVITSGSLIRLSALDDVGLFREEYRMDAIDTEWCFRAWAAGYSVWHVRDVTMRHRVGEGVIQFGPIRFPRQSRSRMQSYARNQFHLLRLGHVPLGWKLRTVVYVPLQIAVFIMQTPGHRVRFAGRMLRSLWDGLSGRLGQTAARDRQRD
ncbi:hypothetical protein LCGC14_0922300 [marine sediment metagenome]